MVSLDEEKTYDQMNKPRRRSSMAGLPAGYLGPVPTWVEDLFRAICADRVKTVHKILRAHRMLDEWSIDEKIFGVLSIKDHRGRKKFVAYGVHAEDQNGHIRQGATCLHLAVWKNAIRVVKLLSALGASTSKEDACGYSAFERVQSQAMRSILCRPAAPRDLCVVSCKQGRAVLQWISSQSKPKIHIFQVVEELHGSQWMLKVPQDVRCFPLSEDREGPLAYLFETPAGSVSSASSYRFAIRSCNDNGFWSEWSEMNADVASTHWLTDWDGGSEAKSQDDVIITRYRNTPRRENIKIVRDEDDRWAEQYKSHGKKDTGKKKRLLLGSRDFGYVRESEWLHVALEEEANAAVMIQAMLRARLQRKKYIEQAWIQRRALQRSGAARILQRFFHNHIYGRAQQQQQQHQQNRKSSQQLHSFKVGLPRANLVQSVLASTSQKEEIRSSCNRQRQQIELAMRKESDRLHFLKESGCDFMASLPSPWH